MGKKIEPKDYWKCYLDEDAKEKVEEMQDHLNRKYDGVSDFLQQKIYAEKPLSLEERKKRERQKMEEHKENFERLQRIEREREEQDKLRDKKELLKEKQKKLRQVQKNGLLSEGEIREEEVEKRRARGHDPGRDRVQEAIDRAVEKRLRNRPDVDELVESVERLQRQVAELNGGRESWFMSLEEEEVEA